MNEFDFWVLMMKMVGMSDDNEEEEKMLMKMMR